MGKHAYLILAHKNMGQLRKLVELLDHPRNDIFIHVDAKCKDFNQNEWTDVCHESSLIFLPTRYTVNWGGVSIIKSELALLKHATQAAAYDYYHLLSGMDLPIKPQGYIHEFFDSHKGSEFINLWKIESSTRTRFKYFTLFPEGENSFPKRISNHIFKGLQMLVGFKINRNVNFHYGSQWFSITDELARYVVEKEPWIYNVFSHTSICDEVFLPTIVCDSRFRDRIFVPTPVSAGESNLGNMRLIDWSRGDSIRHPWTFRSDDMPLLESVDHLWARKFDETVDPVIIEMIYKRLVRK